MTIAALEAGSPPLVDTEQFDSRLRSMGGDLIPHIDRVGRLVARMRDTGLVPLPAVGATGLFELGLTISATAARSLGVATTSAVSLYLDGHGSLWAGPSSSPLRPPASAWFGLRRRRHANPFGGAPHYSQDVDLSVVLAIGAGLGAAFWYWESLPSGEMLRGLAAVILGPIVGAVGVIGVGTAGRTLWRARCEQRIAHAVQCGGHGPWRPITWLATSPDGLDSLQRVLDRLEELRQEGAEGLARLEMHARGELAAAATAAA